MCDPAGKLPLVTRSRSHCDPTYEFEKKLPNGEKVCLLKPIGEASSHIAGGISSANSKLVPAESAFAALLAPAKTPQQETVQLVGQDPNALETISLDEKGNLTVEVPVTSLSFTNDMYVAKPPQSSPMR